MSDCSGRESNPGLPRGRREFSRGFAARLVASPLAFRISRIKPKREPARRLGNRTRASRVAGENSTTEPPVLGGSIIITSLVILLQMILSMFIRFGPNF